MGDKANRPHGFWLGFGIITIGTAIAVTISDDKVLGVLVFLVGVTVGSVVSLLGVIGDDR